MRVVLGVMIVVLFNSMSLTASPNRYIASRKVECTTSIEQYDNDRRFYVFKGKVDVGLHGEFIRFQEEPRLEMYLIDQFGQIYDLGKIQLHHSGSAISYLAFVPASGSEYEGSFWSINYYPSFFREQVQRLEPGRIMVFDASVSDQSICRTYPLLGQ